MSKEEWARYAEDFSEYSDDPHCPVCHAPQERVSCWYCLGDSDINEWDEDDTSPCSECNGVGWYWECTRLPHTDEQVAEYRRRMAT